MTIHIEDGHFKDEHGRTVLFRGVNLGGNSKLPTTPDGATHKADGFFNHREVSFVGRPFPLEEADTHFTRLREWGFTLLRLLVTWEAIEHAGPGIYDEAYLDYITAIVDKAAEYDMLCFIDPHQDVWSRFTGGDGAPGWTLDMIGFEMRNFKATGSAMVHQTHGDPYPRMQWAANYGRLATATMFTLFFAGDDFAPQTQIMGEPAQEFLQRHYIAAVQQIVMRLKDKPTVIGYDTFNEPSRGYVQCQHLGRPDANVRLGTLPTPFQGMLLGMGYSQEVDNWTITPLGQQVTGKTVINPAGVTAWQPGYECVWKQNGIWDVDRMGNPVLLEPFYFAQKPDGSRADFADDYLKPFCNRFAASIREVDADAFIFLEFEGIGNHPTPHWHEEDAADIVYAPHWYDGFTLMTKLYIPWVGGDSKTLRPVFGAERKRRSFSYQVARLKDEAQTNFRNAPMLIGETGIPYDLNEREAYRTGDFSAQIRALDDTMHAIEHNLVSATIWNYCASNDNVYGDQWNGEDLSIFSEDQRDDPDDINSGGRALKALLRPYAAHISGEPLSQHFNIDTGVYQFVMRGEDDIDMPTEFHVPRWQYPHGYTVEVSGGRYETDEAAQRLRYWHDKRDVPHRVVLRPLEKREAPLRDHTGRIFVALFGALLLLTWLLNRRRDKDRR